MQEYKAVEEDKALEDYDGQNILLVGAVANIVMQHRLSGPAILETSNPFALKADQPIPLPSKKRTYFNLDKKYNCDGIQLQAFYNPQEYDLGLMSMPVRIYGRLEVDDKDFGGGPEEEMKGVKGAGVHREYLFYIDKIEEC